MTPIRDKNKIVPIWAQYWISPIRDRTRLGTNQGTEWNSPIRTQLENAVRAHNTLTPIRAQNEIAQSGLEMRLLHKSLK